MKPQSRSRFVGLGLAALLGGAVALLAVPHLVNGRPDAAPRAVTPRGALAADEQAYVDVFRKASPSVVNITSLGVQRDLFSMNVQQVPRGSGTGFVWDDRGHIVTNFHVIQGANARVTLADQSSWDAELVGAFPDRDLAVLRIQAPADKLPPIALGSSRDLLVGQRVYAIGNPFGLDQTLTTGIVSALNREIESFNNRTIRGVIQTDAAIIPADEVNRIVPRLIRDGRFLRPTLGIGAGNAALHRALNLPKGVALIQVVPGGPAARTGLQPFRRGTRGEVLAGDVITAVNDEPLADLDDMLTQFERRQPGETVTLTVWRAGQTRKVSVVLGGSD